MPVSDDDDVTRSSRGHGSHRPPVGGGGPIRPHEVSPRIVTTATTWDPLQHKWVAVKDASRAASSARRQVPVLRS